MKLLAILIIFAVVNTLLSSLIVEDALWRNYFIALITNLFNAIIAISLLHHVSLHRGDLYNHAMSSIEVIQSKLIKYFVSKIIVNIIIAVALMVTTLIAATLLSFLKGAFALVVGFLPILVVTIYFSVKYAMVIHMVVFKGLYYMDALNKSSEYVEGRSGTVLGIQVLPVVFSLAPIYIVPKVAELSTTWGKVFTNFLQAIVFIFSTIALTTLFFHVDKQMACETEDSDQIEIIQ